MLDEIRKKREIISIQTNLLRKIIEEFIDLGFYWVSPVIISKCTDPLWPDPNGSIEKPIIFEIYGQKVMLTQSMIIHKRVLVSSGYDKIFTLSPNIRIEKKHRAKTGRHAYEFTQIDFEVKNAKMDDIFSLVEKIIYKSIKFVSNECRKDFEILGVKAPIIKIPFKIFDREYLEKKYGERWEEKISNESNQPIWVTNIPRYFYDFEDFETGKWRNYDLILPNGYGEVLSGGEREYQYEKIIHKIERDGVNKNKYSLFLKLAKKGILVPSAGGGIGLERLIRWITKSKTIYDVQLFTRKPGDVGEL